MNERLKRMCEISNLKERFDGRPLYARFVNDEGDIVNFEEGTDIVVHYVYQPNLFYPSLMQVNIFDEDNNLVSSKQNKDIVNNCELIIKTGKMTNNKIRCFNKIQILDEGIVVFEKSFEPESIEEGKSITVTYII